MSKRKTRNFFLGALAVGALTLGTWQLASADAKVVATVNGKPISQDLFDAYVKLRNAQQPKHPMDRNAVINELVNRELIYQDALKEKLDKNPEIKRQIELQRQELLIGAALREALSKKPISDAELKKEYDERVAKADVEEYKASHILTKTEAEAKEVIAELDKGANFAELAKKKSTGPSAKNGGDLGWFSPNQMVPEFSAAVAKLQKGSYTKEPVKTQFGWHVILLEDKRKMQPPAFDDVKEQLTNMLRNQQLRAYVEELRSKAKIDIKEVK